MYIHIYMCRCCGHFNRYAGTQPCLVRACENADANERVCMHVCLHVWEREREGRQRTKECVCRCARTCVYAHVRVRANPKRINHNKDRGAVEKGVDRCGLHVHDMQIQKYKNQDKRTTVGGHRMRRRQVCPARARCRPCGSTSCAVLERHTRQFSKVSSIVIWYGISSTELTFENLWDLVRICMTWPLLHKMMRWSAFSAVSLAPQLTLDHDSRQWLDVDEDCRRWL